MNAFLIKDFGYFVMKTKLYQKPINYSKMN